MNAPALNTASTVAPGQSGATSQGVAASGVAAQGAAAGPLAGFEALLAALFPQADPTAAPAGAKASGKGAVADADPLADKKDATDATAGDEAKVDTVGATVAATDPATAALINSLAAPQTPQAESAPAKAADANATAPAFGRDKAKGVPAAPALTNANPNAELDEKAADAVDTAEAKPHQNAKAEAAAPQARPATASIPATPSAPAQSAPPPVEAKAVAAAAPPPIEPEATATAAVVAAAPEQAIAAGAVVRPDAPPAPASAARPGKSERGKDAAKADAIPDALKPTEAVDRPVHARAAEGAAKPASAEVEAAASKDQETKTEVEADQPDTIPQAEARAASQTTPATAHATHGVRAGAETVATLAAQMVKKLEGKSSHFDVELNPGGLGKVNVHIEIGAQGQMTAGMTFDNPQAAADLKARAAELQRALEQAGFDISGGLSFDVAGDNGQRQPQQGWQDQNDNNNGGVFRGQAFRAALDTAGDAADAALNGALRLRRGVTSGLDLRI